MKIIYRFFQFMLSRVIRLLEHKSPIIINSNYALLDVYQILLTNRINNVLVVTTSGMIRRETLKPFFKTLDDNNLKYSIYSDVTPDPTVDCIMEGFKVYQNNKCEAIICIGGGSVIDCAKIINAKTVFDKPISKMKGVLKIHHKLPLFIAVPTTAGTGSEVTISSVVTDIIDGKHYKYPISDYCLLPDYAILDPTLTTSLPKFLTITTALDALTHAFEAYTNLFASKFVKDKALSAIKLILENIDKVINNPNDLKARENMLLGSTYAGQAFTNNFVGYVHALAHAIGALYGYSHGEANAILLVPVLRKYGKSIEKKLNEIAEYCDYSNVESLLKRIEMIKKDNDISFRFERLNKNDYPEIINRAIKEAIPTYPTPQIWTKNDFLDVLNQVK